MRWADVQDIETAYDQVATIFFDTSNTQAFPSASAREQFAERWLNRYLMLFPTHAFIALSDDAAVGYLVSSLEDPASEPIFADLPFLEPFAPVTKHFPAHLHINVAETHRNSGIGRLLVETFIAHAKSQGCPGVHVVTSPDARNVSFYKANKFDPACCCSIDGKRHLLLTHRL